MLEEKRKRRRRRRKKESRFRNERIPTSRRRVEIVTRVCTEYLYRQENTRAKGGVGVEIGVGGKGGGGGGGSRSLACTLFLRGTLCSCASARLKKNLLAFLGSRSSCIFVVGERVDVGRCIQLRLQAYRDLSFLILRT